MLCYEMTDMQSIKSGHVCTTVMYDCIQQTVKITVFYAKSIDLVFTIKTSSTFKYIKVVVAHDN